MNNTRTAMVMLAPSLIGVGLFLLAPLLLVLGLSLLHWDLVSAPTWAGLDNFKLLANNAQFGNSLLVTALFAALALPLSVVGGLAIALALHRCLPGSRFFQVCFVMPWIAAPLALGIVWSWLLAPRGGLVNSLLSPVLGNNIAWMSDTRTALPVLAFVFAWQNVGYIAMFFLAGLTAIPKELYEAATMDGAGAVRRLFAITLPLLRPTTFFVSVTCLISAFQVFDLVYGLTGGHPGYPGGTTDVLTARIFTSAFTSPQIGVAAAMSVVLLAVVLALTGLQQGYFRRRITYDMEVAR